MHHRRNTYVAIAVTIALCLLTISAASAAPKSPFKGLWRAIDLDDSNIQLSIAGGGRGIYQLTWTDDYWSVCDGLPGIGRGVGQLDSGDPNLLHTDIVIRCTSQHESIERQFDAVYHADTDTLEFQFVRWYRVRN
jgi:hypothetical protein